MAEHDQNPTPSEPGTGNLAELLGYAFLGAGFAVVLAKSEAITWFRIQEMFRFQSFHMYGLLGSAVLTAGFFLHFIRRASGLRARNGAAIEIEDKEPTPAMVRYWAGGLLFGVGWGLLGACPGPLYTLVGGGVTVYVVALLAALAGTYVYGRVRTRLPH